MTNIRRSLLLFCISIATIFLATGCSKPNDAQALIAEAKKYRELGDNQAAIIQLKNALQKEPGIGEARYLLGVTYNEVSDPQSAEKELRKALELRFDPAKAMPALGWSLAMQGQYQRVLDEIKLDQNSAEILAVRGHSELALGRLADAANSFKQALNLQPQLAAALLGQARLAVAEGKLDKANELADHILTTTPKNAEAWLLSGDLQRLQSNNDRAVAAYGQVLEIQPGNVAVYMRRAALLANSGKFDAAQADIDAARKITPRNPNVDYAQALLLFRRGKFGPALESVQRVLSVAPDHMPSVVLAGVLQYSLGSPQQAERHMREFLDRNPTSLLAQKLLAFVLLKSNQGESALKTLQPALKQAPQDAQVLALAGEAYMQVRQFAKAADYLQQSAAVAPGDADVHTRLAITGLALGRADRAVAELESAIELDRVLTKADALLVMTYLRKQEYDKALETALKLQKKQPKNPVTYDLLGGAYLGKKDQVNARKSFERALSLQPNYAPAAMLLARMDLRANDPDAARKRFKTMLAKDGKSVGAMIGLASIDRATGNVDGYVSWLEKARAEDASALAPRILLVRHYLLTKDQKKALAIASETRNIEPNHPDVLNALAESQSANGDKAAAVASYASLVGVAPQSPLAHYRLGMAYLANKDYAGAKESLNKALKLKADYVDAEVALALMEYGAGKYDESLRWARQIQRDGSKLPDGYVLEGDSLLAQQKFALAEKAFEQAFARRKSGILATKLHAAQSQAGKAKEADDRLLQWLRENPADTASRLYLADAYVKTRRNQLAIQQYQLVLQSDSKNFLALNNLATLYRQENDPRALDYLEQSYKLSPDNAAIADNLGWVLVEQGKVARGLELLNKAAAQAPDNPDIRYHLAAALAKSGEKTSARAELERLLGKNSAFRHRAEAEALLKQLQTSDQK